MSKKKQSTEVVPVETVSTSLVSPVAGVDTKSFEDACRVILDDASAAANKAYNVARDASDLASKAFHEAAKAECKKWVDAVTADVNAVLTKHGAALTGEDPEQEHYSMMAVMCGGRMFHPHHGNPMETMWSHYRAARADEPEGVPDPASLPAKLRDLHADWLTKRVARKEANDRREELSNRASKLGTEVARYRLMNDKNISQDQMEKIKEMILR
jgi:hypothetical protein